VSPDVPGTTTQQKLRQPFPPKMILRKPASSGRPAQDYVSHVAVVDRLNAVVPGWTFGLVEVIEERGWVEVGENKKRRFVPDPTGPRHVVAVRGWMEIDGVRREEVGEVEHFTTYGDELKKATSDFLKRAAMRWGVAIDLWAKEELSEASAEVEPVPSTVTSGEAHSEGGGMAEAGDRSALAYGEGAGAAPAEPEGVASSSPPPASAHPGHDHKWKKSNQPNVPASVEYCIIKGCEATRGWPDKGAA